MEEKQKLERVKDQLAAGVSEDTVRDTLRKDGHDDAAIDQLFTEARAEDAAAANAGVANTTADGAAVAALPPVGEFFTSPVHSSPMLCIGDEWTS